MPGAAHIAKRDAEGFPGRQLFARRLNARRLPAQFAAFTLQGLQFRNHVHQNALLALNERVRLLRGDGRLVGKQGLFGRVKTAQTVDGPFEAGQGIVQAGQLRGRRLTVKAVRFLLRLGDVHAGQALQRAQKRLLVLRRRQQAHPLHFNDCHRS